MFCGFNDEEGFMPQYREQTDPGAEKGLSRAGIPANTEQDIEKLVAEIGSRIRAAEPQRRDELKQLAETLVHEEISTIQTEPEAAKEYFAQRRPNPLAGGILLTLLGAGLALIFTPVGLSLMLIGLFLVAWGAIMSWARK
jgi:hypothetical protein